MIAIRICPSPGTPGEGWEGAFKSWASPRKPPPYPSPGSTGGGEQKDVLREETRAEFPLMRVPPRRELRSFGGCVVRQVNDSVFRFELHLRPLLLGGVGTLRDGLRCFAVGSGCN